MLKIIYKLWNLTGAVVNIKYTLKNEKNCFSSTPFHLDEFTE